MVEADLERAEERAELGEKYVFYDDQNKMVTSVVEILLDLFFFYSMSFAKVCTVLISLMTVKTQNNQITVAVNSRLFINNNAICIIYI